MWEIYERLIDGVPDGILVEELICGMTWTAVRSSAGAVGLAMTTDVYTLPAERRDYVGMPLREAAEKVRSWNFIEAGIGMAAINAYYNSPQRLAELCSRQPDSRFCSYDIPHAGKNVCMVGALRYPKGLFDDAASLQVMERSIVQGTYPDSASEYFLPGADLVMITGSAFVNKTMPRLLELSKNAEVIIVGPSTPMAPTLLERGARRLAGLVVTEPRGCLAFAAAGYNDTPYRFGERFVLEK